MSEELLDLSRLTPEEREVWDRFMTDEYPSEEGPAVRIWSFGYICMFELGRVPAVVVGRLRELDPRNLVRQYFDNVRRARCEGRL